MDVSAVIETENLSKTYKDFWGRPRVKALDKLNIKVYKGEIFGFIGPNGSGKTTTMKLLLGLLFPTEGKAYVLGKNPTDVAIKFRIGFLPEESYLYRFLNADETLDFFGRIFKIPKDIRKKRIDTLIEQFGLTHARKRQLKEYSKGMMRRVSFAQALINEPDVIFLDEPTSGLDPISSRQIKDLILDLKRQGKTIFLSSHLLADVQDICDRIAILHEGKLRKCGTVSELLVNKDLITMTFRNVNSDLRKKIEELVSREGGQLVSSEYTIENLEAVFLKTINPHTKSLVVEVKESEEKIDNNKQTN